MKKCSRGHGGAIELFTSVYCAVCESVRDEDGLRQFFYEAVKNFAWRHGKAPNRARVGPKMRAALASWRSCPTELISVHFDPEDVKDGQLEILRDEIIAAAFPITIRVAFDY